MNFFIVDEMLGELERVGSVACCGLCFYFRAGFRGWRQERWVGEGVREEGVREEGLGQEGGGEEGMGWR